MAGQIRKNGNLSFLCEISTWNNLWDISPDVNYELQKELASYDKNRGSGG